MIVASNKLGEKSICISSVQSTELLQVFQKAEMAEQDGKVI